MLHALNKDGFTGKHAWCGPSAISILTGAPLAATTAMAAYADDVRYEEVEGMWREDCVLMLHRLGYRCAPVNLMQRYSDTECGPTLQRFIDTRTVEELTTPMLVELHGHFITMHYGFGCDNWTETPVPLREFPKRRRLVKWAALVTRM